MAKSAQPRRLPILASIAVAIGLLALAFFAALRILLGSVGIDVHLTETYFIVAHTRRLSLSFVLIGIAAVAILARSLYARFIGS